MPAVLVAGPYYYTRLALSFPAVAKLSPILNVPTSGGMSRLSGLDAIGMVEPPKVTNPSSNWAWHSWTLLFWSSPLPICQTSYKSLVGISEIRRRAKGQSTPFQTSCCTSSHVVCHITAFGCCGTKLDGQFVDNPTHSQSIRERNDTWTCWLTKLSVEKFGVNKISPWM